MKKLVLCTFILFFLFCGTNAFAVSYSFRDLPGDDTIDLSDKFSSTAEIVDGKVQFTVYNDEGQDNSFIGTVYWDFGAIEDYIEIPDGGAFDVGSSPEIDFSEKKPKAQKLSQSDKDTFSTSYSATAQNAGAGILPGQSAIFSFNIGTVAGTDFDTVLAAVRTALESGDVQLGIHVQGIGDDGEDSDSYLASVTPVPEPATMLLLGAGLIGIAGFGRKKLFKKK